MKTNCFHKIVHILNPIIEKDLMEEIDRINLNSIRMIALFMGIIEIAGLIPMLLGLEKLPHFTRSLISVMICIIICVVVFTVSTIVRKKHRFSHAGVAFFLTSSVVVLVNWGIYVSYMHYRDSDQIITFYTVVVICICFITMKPYISALLVSVSFTAFFLLLYYFDQAVSVQTFNYITFCILCIAGAWARWQVIVSQLIAKREIRHLNEMLQQDVRNVSNEIMAKELEISNMKIKLMQHQISPHFIFNGLSIIKSLIWENREKADESVTEFSMYLRRNIEALRLTDMILFSTEMEHIKAFLAIEQADESVQLTVEYDLQAPDFPVPALSVEPIVENAVIHGVSKRESKAKIVIATREEADCYRIIVADNGTGFDTAVSGRGVGIENTQARLRYQCGGSLTIDSSQEGTTATIRIPKGGGL